MLATIEEKKNLQALSLGTSFTVKTRRLDSYDSASVGFIKAEWPPCVA
jgi:hypothetical protein